MKGRVKEIRLHFALSQEEFGAKLGVTRGAISRIENGSNNLTDQMALLICKEFGISENWLRNGEGDMFLSLDRTEEIAKFTADLFNGEPNSFKERMILALASLNEQQWEVLEEISEQIKKGQ